MRIGSPSSRSNLKIEYSAFDVTLAALSPVIALCLRNAPIWSEQGARIAAGYCLVSLFFSLTAFTAFRIHSAIPRYLTASDMADLAKAVLLGELLTCSVLFTFTRLEGIPRSTPVIHALVLGAGLITARTLIYLADKNRKLAALPRAASDEYVVLIGLSDLSVLYIKLLESSFPDRRTVIAVLDADPRWAGRSVNGVRVFGPPAHLDALIEEFAAHGVHTSLVAVSNPADELPKEVLADLRGVCLRRKLELAFLPALLSVRRARPAPETIQVVRAHARGQPPAPAITPARYFLFKRWVESFLAISIVLALLPVCVLAAALAFADVGSPVVFWQQRIGRSGHRFHLYKFRTLRPSFNRQGQKIPDERRLSKIGQLLRTTRLDELPQLLNVLLGDMSLIGPRPLLPQDQPPNPTVRLMVRPGITGWAQVNGGTLLSAIEKEELDAWYIRHASPWIDLRIVCMTLACLARGDRRSEAALAQARSERRAAADVVQVGLPHDLRPRREAALANELEENRATSVITLS